MVSESTSFAFQPVVLRQRCGPAREISRDIVVSRIFLMLAITALLSGCGKSLEDEIHACSAQAADAFVNTVPLNDFQKREIESREQSVFYRCMISAGFKEKPKFNEDLMRVLQVNYPRASMDEVLIKLNERRAEAMRRYDQHSLWQ